MSLFKLLFWIFLIYLITRLIRFSFYVGKIQNQVRKDYQPPEEESKREGTTTIKYIPEKDTKTEKSTSAKDDDYIDYEEIK
jgi:hypothetical protein